MKEYAVFYERTASNWSAYSPDVPGCVATARTREEVEAKFQSALQFHFDYLREQGQSVPPPTSEVGCVAVVA